MFSLAYDKSLNKKHAFTQGIVSIITNTRIDELLIYNSGLDILTAVFFNLNCVTDVLTVETIDYCEEIARKICEIVVKV